MSASTTATRSLRYAPPPGPDVLDRIMVVPGIDRSSAAGPCCRLLLAHDPLTPGIGLMEVEQAMLGIATGLGLTPSQQGPQPLGPVLRIRQNVTAVGPLHSERLVHVPGRTLALLDYGHATNLLRVPDPPAKWAQLASTYRHVHISVGLDPVADAWDRASSYVHRSAAIGRLWTGTATVRT
ncbi:hypothetical protein [Streptomyces sp. WAC01280]|uniref:hypothetical protein n=1 Tax=Streptomyces sp. WAC01280 TaxID=2487424 RepID=UPI000F76BBA0|nr:hypothetical protein [Streptomyces sp. WAC01280]RSS51357.1 hypothetical protein EF909_34250 [Streptomyces sp. WAC01280]